MNEVKPSLWGRASLVLSGAYVSLGGTQHEKLVAKDVWDLVLKVSAESKRDFSAANTPRLPALQVSPPAGDVSATGD